MNKNVVIFGASCSTGVCAVDAAVNKGLNVRVLLNSQSQSDKLKSWEDVELLEGDVLDIQNVKRSLEGQNAVIVVLASKDNLDRSNVSCEGIKNIIAVMELLHIKVISVCFQTKTLHQLTQTARDALEQDEIRTMRVLEASNLHWVAVVAPRISDGSPTGYSIVRSHANAEYPAVSRRDLAAFLVDCLAMPERYQKTVEIASLDKR